MVGFGGDGEGVGGGVSEGVGRWGGVLTVHGGGVQHADARGRISGVPQGGSLTPQE